MEHISYFCIQNGKSHVDKAICDKWYSSSEDAKTLDSGITSGLHKMYIIEIVGAYMVEN